MPDTTPKPSDGVANKSVKAFAADDTTDDTETPMTEGGTDEDESEAQPS